MDGRDDGFSNDAMEMDSPPSSNTDRNNDSRELHFGESDISLELSKWLDWTNHGVVSWASRLRHVNNTPLFSSSDLERLRQAGISGPNLSLLTQENVCISTRLQGAPAARFLVAAQKLTDNRSIDWWKQTLRRIVSSDDDETDQAIQSTVQQLEDYLTDCEKRALQSTPLEQAALHPLLASRHSLSATDTVREFEAAVMSSVSGAQQECTNVVVRQLSGAGKTKLCFDAFPDRYVLVVQFVNAEIPGLSEFLLEIDQHVKNDNVQDEMSMERLGRALIDMHDMILLWLASWVELLTILHCRFSHVDLPMRRRLLLFLGSSKAHYTVRTLFLKRIASCGDNIHATVPRMVADILRQAPSFVFVLDDIQSLHGLFKGCLPHGVLKNPDLAQLGRQQCSERAAESSKLAHSTDVLSAVQRSCFWFASFRIPVVFTTTDYAVLSRFSFARDVPGSRDFRPYVVFDLHQFVTYSKLLDLLHSLGIPEKDLNRSGGTRPLLPMFTGRPHFFFDILLQSLVVTKNLDTAISKAYPDLQRIVDSRIEKWIQRCEQTKAAVVAKELLAFSILFHRGKLRFSHQVEALCVVGLATSDPKGLRPTQHISEPIVRHRLFHHLQISPTRWNRDAHDHMLKALDWMLTHRIMRWVVAEHVIALELLTAASGNLSVLEHFDSYNVRATILRAEEFRVDWPSEIGRTTDFELPEEVSAASWELFQRDKLIFPSNSAGPDLIAYLTSGAAIIFQAKAFENVMTFSKTASALRSLEFQNFYHPEQNEVKRQEFEKSLKDQPSDPFRDCVKVLVSLTGFSDDVVAETKLRNARNPSEQILLFCLSKIDPPPRYLSGNSNWLTDPEETPHVDAQDDYVDCYDF